MEGVKSPVIAKTMMVIMVEDDLTEYDFHMCSNRKLCSQGTCM